MIENVDANVGRLEEFLEREGLRDDTLLVFLTDNGSTMGDRYFNAGMKGGKVTLWEGGHRVPCFVRWPAGGLGPPRDVAALTQVQDLMPTLLELVGAPPPGPLDGISLAPLLRDGVALPDRKLVIHYSRMPTRADPAAAAPRREGAAVLWRNWRLLEDRALYDVLADPAQGRDVAAGHPEIVAAMRVHLDAWWAGVEARVNEPSRIVIGDDAENPMLLTACEWWDVFVDQQAQVRRGELKNGRWHLEVAQAGEYEIELRRWPREADLPLDAPAPAVELADGRLPPGRALPIAHARLRLGGVEQRRDVAPGATHAVFRVPLPAGAAELETEFTSDDGEIRLGAYYAYVRRL